MWKLLRYQLSEIYERKFLFHSFLFFEACIIIAMFVLPSTVLLCGTIVLGCAAFCAIAYADGITIATINNPVIDRRKLILALPVSRMEYAVRSIILYTSFIIIQVAFIAVVSFVSSLHNPTIIQEIPTLLLGTIVSCGAIVGTLFIGSSIKTNGIGQILVNITLLLLVCFYIGYLIGYSAKGGDLPDLWILLVSLYVYLIGIGVELFVTTRID